MGNEIQVFDYEGKGVKTIQINNETWYSGNDSCKALNIANAPDAMKRLNPEDKTTIVLTDSGNLNQKRTFISFSGLNDLILDSKKPEAKKFRRWITSVVIPSIAKTGSYSIAKPTTPAIPKSFSEALQLAADQARMIEQMQPKVLNYDKFIDATTTISQTYCAKLLGVRPKRFFEWLKEIEAEYKNNSQLIRNKYLMNGWFVQKLFPQEVSKNGKTEIHARERARITMKGLQGLEKLAKEQGLTPMDYVVEFKPEPTTEIQNINNIDITDENLDFDDQDIDASKINLDDVLGE